MARSASVRARVLTVALLSLPLTGCPKSPYDLALDEAGYPARVEAAENAAAAD